MTLIAGLQQEVHRWIQAYRSGANVSYRSASAACGAAGFLPECATSASLPSLCCPLLLLCTPQHATLPGAFSITIKLAGRIYEPAKFSFQCGKDGQRVAGYGPSPEQHTAVRVARILHVSIALSCVAVRRAAMGFVCARANKRCPMHGWMQARQDTHTRLCMGEKS